MKNRHGDFDKVLWVLVVAGAGALMVVAAIMLEALALMGGK